MKADPYSMFLLACSTKVSLAYTTVSEDTRPEIENLVRRPLTEDEWSDLKESAAVGIQLTDELLEGRLEVCWWKDEIETFLKVSKA